MYLNAKKLFKQKKLISPVCKNNFLKFYLLTSQFPKIKEFKKPSQVLNL